MNYLPGQLRPGVLPTLYSQSRVRVRLASSIALGGLMRTVLVCLSVVLAVGACKKSGTSGGGGGGGPPSWLVGNGGLMVAVQTNGEARGYPLASAENLNGIACRYSGEAWVVGTHGTLLYTDDAGKSWRSQPVPTSAELRA